MKKHYLKENLEKVVKESFSYAEVARKIGLIDKGGNINVISRYINKYGIDISHFTSQTWNKGQGKSDKVSIIKLEDILKENTKYSSHRLKLRLVECGLKTMKCEKCGTTEWMGEPLTLELHHINGNHYDNRLENLQILCPNCHSQTSSFKKRKKNEIPPNFSKKEHICICQTCGKEFNSDRDRKFCSRECYNKSLSQEKNNFEITEINIKNAMINCKTISELSSHFNVSRPTIRKYLNKFNLLDEFKEIYAIDSLHSKKIIQYDLNMNFIKEWGSIADAEETLGITSIGKCLCLKRKTAGGFIWRYVEG